MASKDLPCLTCVGYDPEQAASLGRVYVCGKGYVVSRAPWARCWSRPKSAPKAAEKTDGGLFE